MKCYKYYLILLILIPFYLYAAKCQLACTPASSCEIIEQGKCKKGLVCCSQMKDPMVIEKNKKLIQYNKLISGGNYNKIYYKDPKLSIFGHRFYKNPDVLQDLIKASSEEIPVKYDQQKVLAQELFEQLLNGNSKLLSSTLTKNWDSIIQFGNSKIIVTGPKNFFYKGKKFDNFANWYVRPEKSYDDFIKEIGDVSLKNVLEVLLGHNEKIIENNDEKDYLAKTAIVASIFAEGRRKISVSEYFPKLLVKMIKLSEEEKDGILKCAKASKTSNTANFKTLNRISLVSEIQPNIEGFILANPMTRRGSTTFDENDLKDYFECWDLE